MTTLPKARRWAAAAAGGAAAARRLRRRRHHHRRRHDRPPNKAAEPVIDPGDGGDYAPELDPADFVAVIDNPYLPFTPGMRWVYEGEEDGETERVEVEVLDETRVIQGITATVVRDTVYVDGELAEDTYDWYAQDTDGNVWYLGEDTHEYEDGEAVNAEGAWEYGDGRCASRHRDARPPRGRRRVPAGVLRGRGGGHGRGAGGRRDGGARDRVLRGRPGAPRTGTRSSPRSSRRSPTPPGSASSTRRRWPAARARASSSSSRPRLARGLRPVRLDSGPSGHTGCSRREEQTMRRRTKVVIAGAAAAALAVGRRRRARWPAGADDDDTETPITGSDARPGLGGRPRAHR